MDEIASTSESTRIIMGKGYALFGLVVRVYEVMAFKLVISVCKFAFVLVGAGAMFHPLPAEVRFGFDCFLFVYFLRRMRVGPIG